MMTMGVNGASTIFGLSSREINARSIGYCLNTMFGPFFDAKTGMNSSLHDSE